MTGYLRLSAILSLAGLGACAQIAFHEDYRPDALAFYDPVPYMFVGLNAECVWSATLITMPGKRRSLSLQPGIGSSEFGVSLNNGMISSVSQKSDTKLPETISAVSGLATAIGTYGAAGPTKPKCQPSGHLYPIEDGRPNRNKGIVFPGTLVPPPAPGGDKPKS